MLEILKRAEKYDKQKRKADEMLPILYDEFAKLIQKECSLGKYTIEPSWYFYIIKFDNGIKITMCGGDINDIDNLRAFTGENEKEYEKVREFLDEIYR